MKRNRMNAAYIVDKDGVLSGLEVFISGRI